MKFKKFVSYTPIEKLRSDPFFCRIFFRPISFIFAYILYYLNIRANYVSMFATVLVIPIFIFVVIGWFNLAMILVVFFAIADCVDGNLARVEAAEGKMSGTTSGSWLDACSGYVFYAFFPISIGFYAEARHDLYGLDGLYQIVASLMAVSNILLRLMHQKLINETRKHMQQTVYAKERYNLSFKGEFGFLGFMIPFCILTHQLDFLELFLVFYLFVYSVGCMKIYLSNINLMGN